MTQKNNDMLTQIHKWITVTAIPALLTIILYFLIKVDKKIDFASDAVIRHEQQLIDHERRLTSLHDFIFKPRN